ncbi:hypothetical protein ACLB6K_07880 [Microcystis aeruginosa FACHB-524]|uniref:hypothetical protein n=1 Tax=Microcystis aeruginosa TaxID=1126 RepID=UPI000F44A1EE|nr:hypothetical protein [Microcystis aeruginosa]ROI07504.1 hypothetical protein ED562_07740 [Microcystis aeruginosa FACHB-524]
MSLGTLIEFYFKLIICITIPEEPFIHDYNAQQSKGLSHHHYYRITTGIVKKAAITGVVVISFLFSPVFWLIFVRYRIRIFS